MYVIMKSMTVTVSGHQKIVPHCVVDEGIVEARMVAKELNRRSTKYKYWIKNVPLMNMDGLLNKPKRKDE